MTPNTEKLPENYRKDWWLSILYNLIISAGVFLPLVYVLGAYGLALFVVLPFFIGFFPVWIYSAKKKRIRGAEAIGLGSASLLFHLLVLLAFGGEGLICVVMALPLLFIITITGAQIAYEIRKYQRKKSRSRNTSLMGVIALFPLFSLIDKYQEPALTKVTTSIVINAEPEEVRPG